ncbi:heavy metal-associated isoprenylated plant protein 39-like isoform X1 [Panicum virgatum]|uniref:heavy metal-associated isoprenylated plant protein 39-like isoform X1 n=1 Tax=Panicum virgatum TaxID=38727 RepID=UPI0019D54EAC|nr:heavy metal-associated isoprenylated plant protein 39-like isoform X1 [Panicum virgatum]
MPAQQKVVLKVSSMSDEKVKQKAMETVADIYGIDSIGADHKEQKMTVIGDMDPVEITKKLKKFGKIDIVSVGPAKDDKDDKKGGKK